MSQDLKTRKQQGLRDWGCSPLPASAPPPPLVSAGPRLQQNRRRPFVLEKLGAPGGGGEDMAALCG